MAELVEVGNGLVPITINGEVIKEADPSDNFARAIREIARSKGVKKLNILVVETDGSSHEVKSLDEYDTFEGISSVRLDLRLTAG